MRKSKDATDAYGRSNQDVHSLKKVFLSRLSYSRFFEDYYVIPRPDGSGKQERIYAGPIYHQEVDQKQKIWLRVAYAMIFILSVLLFYGSTVLDTPSNRNIAVWLCILPAVILDVIQAMALYTYISAGVNFTVYEYKNGPEVLRLSPFYSAGAKLISVIAIAVLLIVNGGSSIGMELLRIGMVLVSAALIFSLRIVERRIDYTYQPASEVPENAVKM